MTKSRMMDRWAARMVLRALRDPEVRAEVASIAFDTPLVAGATGQISDETAALLKRQWGSSLSDPAPPLRVKRGTAPGAIS